MFEIIKYKKNHLMAVNLIDALSYDEIKRLQSCLHFLYDRQNHVETGTFSWVFVHADPDQTRHLGRRTRWNFYSKTFQRNLREPYLVIKDNRRYKFRRFQIVYIKLL